MKVKFVGCRYRQCCCCCGYYFYKMLLITIPFNILVRAYIMAVTMTIKFHFLWCCSKEIVSTSTLACLSLSPSSPIYVCVCKPIHIFGRNESKQHTIKWCIFLPFLLTKNCNDAYIEYNNNGRVEWNAKLSDCVIVNTHARFATVATAAAVAAT